MRVDLGFLPKIFLGLVLLQGVLSFLRCFWMVICGEVVVILVVKTWSGGGQFWDA
jgi:hypothetical protein